MNLQTYLLVVLFQVLNPKNYSSQFSFLDGNNWPISSEQENHMTVSHILIGSCVNTDIRISHGTESVEFSPPDRPPCKRLKGLVHYEIPANQGFTLNLD